MVVTFLLTCISTLVFSSLCLLLMKRSGNARAQSKLQKQSEPAVEGTYEMVNTEKMKATEAEYEVIDHNKKGVTLEENPAYSVHTCITSINT